MEPPAPQAHPSPDRRLQAPRVRPELQVQLVQPVQVSVRQVLQARLVLRERPARKELDLLARPALEDLPAQAADRQDLQAYLARQEQPGLQDQADRPELPDLRARQELPEQVLQDQPARPDLA